MKEFEKLKQDYPQLMDLYCFSGICDGWVTELVRPLCEELKNYSIKFNQIKEKFGGLRLYYTLDIDEQPIRDLIESYIEKAENESYHVCEICGSRENVTTEGGWLRTLCATCSVSG